MKQLVLGVSLLGFALTAQAGLMNTVDLVRLAKDIDNVEVQQSIREDIIRNPQSIHGWFRSWTGYQKQPEYPQTWPVIAVKLLEWAYPSVQPRWQKGTDVAGLRVPVYVQNGLVDLERAHAYHLQYPVTTGTVHGYPIADSHNPKHQTIATSQRRLVMGLPPIGPDNYPVHICKIGRSSQSPYIELSQTQMLDIQAAIGLPFTACLVGDQAKNHWQNRYHDLVNRYHEVKDTHQPGTSW